MIATDFEYDGVLLSDLGFMICQFDESGGFVSSSAGSTLNITTVAQNSGRRHIIVGADYKDRNEQSFSICKRDGSRVTSDEYGLIMRWLNRSVFCELTILTLDWQRIHFMCTFNLAKVEHRGSIIGFDLTAITNSTFGWGDPIQDDFVIPSAGDSHDILDESDEIGYSYPDSIKITCNASGDLMIVNSTEPGRKTVITGCVTGEVIQFNGKTFEISSDSEDNIYDRFNYNYVRISNTSSNSTNSLTFSLPCDVSLTYTPVRKVVF